ncbi:septum formation family protein [Asanoa sp. WMMD1127]|uniref:septum formation family protein n=1 Tax=Asanoa sp. WMMD1127 TaxID=3016107 RepID=UPI00241796F9|nr:septum formation family protein [Asanoa sp. WMMD1127]MDG4822437.1 septum formation family protein [Asanoa sp. WMMD1127]
MRRWTAAVVVLVLASAACGSNGSGGGGGGQAAAPGPSAQTSSPPPRCHAQVAEGTADARDGTVDCAAPHLAETVHIGEFTGAAATADSFPPPVSRAMAAVYDECDKRAATALGDDWRVGRLRLDVVLPSTTVWTAGERWFRCDLVELTGVGPDGKVAQRSGSLAGGLEAPDAPLRLRCVLVKLDRKANVATVADSPCDVKHEGEFVGVWTAPGKVAYPVKDRDYVPFYEGCLKTIAAYVKVPYAPGFAARTGYVPVLPSKNAWAMGDRDVRCFLWVRFRPLNTSQKGVGEKGFPANIGQSS